MNRNTESHFSELPQVDIGRSMFDRSASHKTSFNVGELIPFFIDEVLPGDTFNVTTSAVVRLQTLLTPVMDNVYLDTYFFFTPSRILWSHWKEFMGENTESAWIPSTEYSVPLLKYPEGGFNVGTIADYLGVPTGVAPDFNEGENCPIALPFRAYAMIADQWFRDQNVMDPLNIPLGDSNQNGSNGTDYITDVVNGGKPFKVSKYHDYFTSALPSPQKGDPSVVPIVDSNNNGVNYFPVGTGANNHWPSIEGDPSFTDLKFTNNTGEQSRGFYRNETSPYSYQGNSTGAEAVAPINLWADFSGANITVNDLRIAFQLQKFYEKNARAGTRYREVLREHFGVTSPDARMMIPEYLGGHRFPLSIHQVANTSQGESDFLGDLGAMSNTADVHDDFIKSFTEHGYVIGVCCVRYDHSYPQGLNKMFSRRSKLDYYWPVFANIGEQPIRNREIYLDDSAGEDNSGVFGYQEAWAEYRYMPNRVSGEMRPDASQSLASWHLADDYSALPTLSSGWMFEDKTNVDRVLAVTSSVSNQVFADFYVKNIVTRAMPMYSIPGLVDHH